MLIMVDYYYESLLRWKKVLLYKFILPLLSVELLSMGQFKFNRENLLFTTFSF